MLAALRSLAALFGSAAFMTAGNGLLTTLLALRAQHEGFPAWAIGPLLSAYSLGFLAGCIYLPRHIRAVGHIRTYAALAALSSACTLAYLLLIAPSAWLALRAVHGFCFAGLGMVNDSWLNERAENANRGRVLSVFRVVDLGSNTAGQLLLLFASPDTFQLFAVVAMLLALAIIPVSLTRSTAPAPIAAIKVDLPGLFSVSPLAVMTCFTVGIANGGFWSLGPVFAQEHGLEASKVSLFMSTAIVAGVVSQFPVGFLSDRLDRRIVLIGVTMLASLASLALANAPQGPTAWLFAATALYGAAAMPMYGLAVAHANDSARRGEFVRISSGLLLSYSVGAMIGPVIAGFVMTHFGAPRLFVYTALCQALLVIFGLYRVLKRPPHRDHKSDLVSVPNVTPEVFNVESERDPAE